MRRLAAAVLGILLCFGARAELQPGDVPPAHLGNARDGHAVELTSLHGKVVVISFWATWCGYCMKEMPILAGLQSTATARGLPLQVVSIDYMEDRDTFHHVDRILKQRLPALLVTWDRDGHIGKAYGTSHGIPVMVMLHRDGTVASVHIGYSEDVLDSLIGEINDLLREPADPPAMAAVH